MFSPLVAYLEMTENLGFGAGLANGLDALRDDDLEFFWLLDDDSPPAPDALRDALLVANTDSRIGVVANRGGHIRWGRIRHDLGAGTVKEVAEADFALVDGSLITREATLRAGIPRRDLFMMMEDFDYTTRIRECGLRVVVRPADGSHFGHLGSTGPASAWRGYYQSRNLLRIALDRRKPAWVWGWFVRECGICGHYLIARNWNSLRLRFKGTVDGARNRMGRTVEPH